MVGPSARERAMGLLMVINQIKIPGVDVSARDITGDLINGPVRGHTSEERVQSRELKKKEESRKETGGWRVQVRVRSDEKQPAADMQTRVRNIITELGGVIQPGTGIVDRELHVLDGGGSGYFWENYGATTNVTMGIEDGLKNDQRMHRPDIHIGRPLFQRKRS